MFELLQLKQNLFAQHAVPLPYTSREGRKFSFHWIQDCPSDEVLALRNAPHVLEFIAGHRAISADEHRAFLSDYSSKTRFDFMIYCDTSGEWVGGVNVAQTEYGLEMGKHIGRTAYLGGGVGKGAAITFLEYLKEKLPPGTSIVARTKANNQINIALNRSIGFSIIKRLPDDFILMRRVL